MTVMEMLETATDLYGVRIRVFDCNSEEIIFDSKTLSDNEDPVMEVYMSDFDNYEVGSYDLYLHNGEINLEMNIDYEGDDDE
jgi:hypothetical protein